MANHYFNPANSYDAQHHGSETLAINNTRARRFLALLALRTTAKFFRADGPCVPISKHRMLKRGYSLHLTEAVTMRYIAQHTAIPVPKVHCSFLHKNRAYIVMERIQGETLAAAWKHLAEESRKMVFSQLKDMIRELRARTREYRVASAPRCTIAASHTAPRASGLSRIGDHVSEKDVEDLRKMILKQDGPWPSPVFTHCDLNPSNILIRDDRIVGLIDWEFSGWYPAYWEYTSAWLGNILRSEWQSTLLSLLDPYTEELEMEKFRSRWWGEW
ncbi:hypothetical protein QTJ16_003774 [Diplocarpon rosae]|uniref:Aminoglycoside phosphotransferase domain-containing protein n=1 Tax=Diplocarpon rosae TaxID=946125 RepID=A0AAD9WF26_9HELO|nr:hypothetical protein QTJ16_003774 [Diplocarpon rosae]